MLLLSPDEKSAPYWAVALELPGPMLEIEHKSGRGMKTHAAMR